MTGPLIIEDDTEPYAEVPDKLIFLQDWYAQNADSNFQFWGQNKPAGGNCVTFGGSRFTGDLNPFNLPGVIGAVVGDGMFFQSFIVNGLGLYEYEATQVSGIGEGNQTFQDMRCPGQYLQAPKCEYCFNADTWESEVCTEQSGNGQSCGQPAVIEVEAGSQSRLRLAHAGGLFPAQGKGEKGI